MLENALVLRNYTSKKKFAVKTLVSLGLVVLAVALPQLVHLALGQPGGAKWLPMYLPVLIGGCLLGSKWALSVGILSPVVSFAFTSLFLGEPMPAAARLPFMVVELAVFAAVSGLFSKKISENGLWAFVAVACAQVSGRAVFLALAKIFDFATPFAFNMIVGQVKTGVIGLGVQLAIVPIIIVVLKKLMERDNENA
ncbi:MAG: hypothetical protein IJS17_02840 [Clostridia bacterium]|nr:hypothetical protein [Clostridia bacterium]